MAKKLKSNPLLDAIRLLAYAQHGKGDVAKTHSVLENHTAIATDGVLAAGVMIQEDLTACPQTAALLLALERCGETFAVVHYDATRLLVRSADWQAFIPCCDRSKLTTVQPDAPMATVDARLTDALAIVLPLASKTAASVVQGSIQLNAGHVRATDKTVLLEAWHGHDLPNGLLIPKVSASAVVKCKRTLTALGFSPTSVTFWFGNEAWIKTRTFSEKWPNVDTMLDVEHNSRIIPQSVFDAIKRVAPFSTDGLVYCRENVISSHSNFADAGSQLAIPVQGGFKDRSYKAKELLSVMDYCLSADDTQSFHTLFFGDKVRGMITHFKILPPIEPCKKCTDGTCEDCLPF